MKRCITTAGPRRLKGGGGEQRSTTNMPPGLPICFRGLTKAADHGSGEGENQYRGTEKVGSKGAARPGTGMTTERYDERKSGRTKALSTPNGGKRIDGLHGPGICCREVNLNSWNRKRENCGNPRGGFAVPQ